MKQFNKVFPVWLRALLYAIGIILILFILLFILVRMERFGPVPSITELNKIQQHQASQLISSDHQLLGTYPIQEDLHLTLDDISPDLINALLAIEDIRFYRHNGIDYRALGRVLIRTILLRQDAGGGSTLTQQLAKNLYPRINRRGLYLLTDKLREMIIAKRLESTYSKDEILSLYLNTVSFGENTFGIDLASHRFFNKAPSDLSLPESAALAGQLKATTFYNPHRNPERAEQRRNLVIRQMEKYDMISEEVAVSVIEEPLQTDYNRTGGRNETALHFKHYLQGKLKVLLQNVQALDGKQYRLETDGLAIYTSLNSQIQRAAEEAVSSHMKKLQEIFDLENHNGSVFHDVGDPDVMLAWQQSGTYRELVLEGFSEEELKDILYTPVSSHLFTWNGYEEQKLSPYDELRYYLSFLNAGLIAIHPETGHILAWIGGINHRHFPYDQVLAKRQPGSTFKPIVYAAALEEGRAPCDYVRNRLTTFASYDDWTPRNHEEEYGGYYSLQASLAKSVNTATVQLGMNTGISAIQRTAKSMGIRSMIPDQPSIVLGTAETTLLELTTAYTTFLNKGIPVSPVLITHILNSEGDLIYDFRDDESTLDHQLTHLNVNNSNQPDGDQSKISEKNIGLNQGISPETAAAMVQILEKAINEGTGYPLRSQFGITHALGGKTGTTQNYADGWFIGFTPEMVFGVRVGGWNHRVHFREFPAFASQTALPIAGHFLNSISAHQTLTSLPNQFPSHMTHSPYNMECSDTRGEKFGDRLRNFFTGRSSDDPVVIGEEEEDEEEKKGGNFFKRLGRKLGISDN